MRQKLPNIRSNDGRFHNGNPATGSLGTIVDDAWLNNVQDTLQDFFEELKNVLMLGGLQPIPAKQDQVAKAIEKVVNARVAKSGDTMTGHLQINVNDWSSVRLFNRAGKHFIAEVRPDSASGAFGTLIYREGQDRDLARLALPQKNGTVALLEEIVSKSGDTMTGNLEIDRADSYVLGKQGGAKRWFVGKGGANSNDVALYNYAYNYGLTLKADRVESSKPYYVGNNRVPHSGDAYLDLASSNYGGVRISRSSRNDVMLVESYGNAFALIRRGDDGQNAYQILTPEKSGTIALAADVVSKSGDAMTGNLEIDRADSYVLGKQGGAKRWFVGKGGADSNDVALYSYTYNYGLTLKADRVESSKPYYVGNNRVPHSGDAYLDLASSNYGGVRIDRAERGDVVLMESHDDQCAFIRRNRSNGKNISVTYIPSRNGTVLLNNDLVGVVCHFASTSPPTGWLKANGAAVSRTTYAELFAKIGTTYGAGDGRTTFNLPDLRGEFVRGWDDGRNVDAGRRLGSYQSDELRSHSHSVNWQTYPEDGATSDRISSGGSREADSRINLTTNNTGGSETRPRNVALLACIKY